MKKTSLLNKKILILGSDGLVGGALIKKLKTIKGVRVYGTTRRKKKFVSNHYFKLDLLNKSEIETFPWHTFEVIINCAGTINYANNAMAAYTNMLINTVAPLWVIEHLNSKQIYFHCSSYVVLLSPDQHNTYSLSKYFFETYLSKISALIAPKVVLMRIPGIFDEKRDAGVVSLIKRHFLEQKKLQLDFAAYQWHIMYLPRLVDCLVSLLRKNCNDRYVNIGYPTETSIDKILIHARKAFQRIIPITFRNKLTDHFIPNTRTQSRYTRVHSLDFEKDIIRYFKKP